MATTPSNSRVKIHPLIVRVTHLLNALAIIVMILSGWRIYDASPLFSFTIPRQITLGGWLAGIKVTIFLRDMSNFAKIVELRGRYFTAPYPADTIVEVSSLYSPEALIEIEAIAVIDEAVDRT